MIIWYDNVNVAIKSKNKNIINAYVCNHQNKLWQTCLYGHPDFQLQNQVWEQLLVNAQSLDCDDEWLVLGDFNQPLVNKDKLSFKCTELRVAQSLLTVLINVF